MKLDAIRTRVAAGERVMVNLPYRPGCDKTYNLTDGTPVRASQFEKLRDELVPCDLGLLPDSEPMSYRIA